MLTNTYRLSMEPGVPDLNVYISQYDVGKTLVFTLVNTATSASISSGVNVEIRGTKPDGHGFSYNQSSVVSYSYSNSTATVTVHVQEQMTAVAGKVVCEIILYKGTPATTTTPASSGYQQLGTANFYLNVERAALDKDTLRSASSIRQLVDVIDRTDELLEAAEDIQEAYRDYNNKSVRYDIEQNLTKTQKSTACNNIGALSNNQGSANEGFALVVGPEGIVVPAEVGLSDSVKNALLNVFKHVAYVDEYGQMYYEALRAALFEDIYPRIRAFFSPGSNTIFVDDGLDALKQYLTVVLYRNAGDSGTTISNTDYVLSGTLADGVNTVIASYNGLITSFRTEAVDFYNKFIWRQSFGDILPRANTEGFREGIGSGIYLDVDSNKESTRFSFTTNHGRVPFVLWDSITQGEAIETSQYPIPIPAGAKSLRITSSTPGISAGVASGIFKNGSYIKYAESNFSPLPLNVEYLPDEENSILLAWFRKLDNSAFDFDLEGVTFEYSTDYLENVPEQYQYRNSTPESYYRTIQIHRRLIAWNSARNAIYSYASPETDRRIFSISSYNGKYETIPVNADGEVVSDSRQYAFSIPSSATSVTITTNPAYQLEIFLVRFVNGIQELVSKSEWLTSPAVLNFEASENITMFANLRASASQEIISTLPSVDIEFE